jgi:hypothetical protein
VSASRVVELRQYTLHPGQREVLIELFDREFVESQEALGMEVVGQFRNVDHPDRFVWLRGFPDMATRHQALTAFYGGPVWAAHKDVANATMIDFDDVLLLRPATPGGTFPRRDRPRPPVGSTHRPRTLVTVTIHRLTGPADTEVLDLLHRVQPLIVDAGATPLATLRTETAANTYHALPVREDRHVVVTFTRHDDSDDHARHQDRLTHSRHWQELQQQLRPHLTEPPQHLRLRPTARSLLS